jgi:hypothetical protein
MIRSVNAICSMGAAALSLALASSAGAATNVGSAFPPTDACSEDTTTIQTTSPGDAYAAPSDGVITRWSYYAASSPPPRGGRRTLEQLPDGREIFHRLERALVGAACGQRRGEAESGVGA